MLGEDLRCRGIVRRVYEQDGEHRVELEIWIEDPRGEVTTPGTAVVALPSRRAGWGAASVAKIGRDDAASRPRRAGSATPEAGSPRPRTIGRRTRSTSSSPNGRASVPSRGSLRSPSRPGSRGSRRSCNSGWNVRCRGSAWTGGSSSSSWPSAVGDPFRMSPRELHRLLLLSPAAVTNRLYRLETKGLIERVADPLDRRSLPVLLTPLGLSAVERAMAACSEVERDLLVGGDPDEMEVTLATSAGSWPRTRSIRQSLRPTRARPGRRGGRSGSRRRDRAGRGSGGPGRTGPALSSSRGGRTPTASSSASSASSRGTPTRPRPGPRPDRGRPRSAGCSCRCPRSRARSSATSRGRPRS